MKTPSENTEQIQVINWADQVPLSRYCKDLDCWNTKTKTPGVKGKDAYSSRPVRIGDLMYHVPNEGWDGGAKVVTGPDGKKRRFATRAAGTRRKMGLRSGMSDLVLDLPRGQFMGLVIEMKRRRDHYRTAAQERDGKPPTSAALRNAFSTMQLEWLRRQALCGRLAVGCFGASEAIRTIERYLDLGQFFFELDESVWVRGELVPPGELFVCPK